jgi:hypothetical protein
MYLNRNITKRAGADDEKSLLTSALVTGAGAGVGAGAGLVGHGLVDQRYASAGGKILSKGINKNLNRIWGDVPNVDKLNDRTSRATRALLGRLTKKRALNGKIGLATVPLLAIGGGFAANKMYND